MKRIPAIGAAAVLAVAIVAIDQIVKWAAMGIIGPNPQDVDVWLFNDWLGLSYVENRGVAFGLLDGASETTLAMAAVVVLGVVAAFVWEHRSSPLTLFAGAAIVGGAIGNVIDRIRYGYVRDFFAIGPWPSFNVADAAITVGVVLAVLGTLRMEHNNEIKPTHSNVGRRTIMDSSE